VSENGENGKNGKNGTFVGAAGRAAARGAAASMAMTGMRRVTENLGLLEQSPPEAIVGEQLSGTQLTRNQREVAIELAHWGFGAAAGAVYEALPGWFRRRRFSGPAYGLAIWLGFEVGVAPLLGFPHARQNRIAARLMVALDHALYGMLVAGRFAPQRP
jgi:hypothetical protein